MTPFLLYINIYILFVLCFELRKLLCVLFWFGNLEGILKLVIFVSYFGLVHS